ncbi:MAG: DNA polymerase III subunit chi [Methylococcales bacterium]|nr:DNA polymerase III subunit chi [Methylococcales bacterium]
MPRLSFYILSSDEERQRSFFCCKLIEKAYREGYLCYLLTDSDNQSRMLDNLLWTFRPMSFIPHALYSGQLPTSDDSVLIGSLPPPDKWKKVVINFSAQPLPQLDGVERLLEIVDNHPQRKQVARNRYRYYRQQGLSIQTFPIQIDS